MTITEAPNINLTVSDVSGQKIFSVPQAPPEATIGELVHSLLSRMNLPENDSTGQPIAYAARLEREGRHLNSSEQIGDALQPGDKIQLQPNIDAGLNP